MWKSTITTINAELAEHAEKMRSAVSAASALYVVLLFGLVVVAFAPSAAQTPPHAQLVIVVDGLRPDYVTPALMPRLVRLGQRGIVFNAHHSVFPTVTRVNASSMATGTYPESHGLLGNTVYIPAVNADQRARHRIAREPRSDRARQRSAADRAVARRDPAGSRERRCSRSDPARAAPCSCSNHTVGTGAIVHQEFTRPAVVRRARARDARRGAGDGDAECGAQHTRRRRLPDARAGRDAPGPHADVDQRSGSHRAQQGHRLGDDERVAAAGRRRDRADRRRPARAKGWPIAPISSSSPIMASRRTTTI